MHFRKLTKQIKKLIILIANERRKVLKTQIKESNSNLSFVSSMFIFGTIGLFVKQLPFPSAVISLFRGILGLIFLIAISIITKRKTNFKIVKTNLLKLLISGAFMGFNWILLFEAYNYTTIATATLCYYLAPIFVLLFSGLVTSEKLTAKKIICILLSLIGMILISNIFEVGFSNLSELKGVIFGTCAAILYSCVILINKTIKQISGTDRTMIQLFVSVIVLLPYCLLTKSLENIHFSSSSIIIILIIGFFHTGFAYKLYFSSVAKLKASSIAIYSYIDPVVAVAVSAIVLGEKINIFTIIGAILILGSTFISEFNFIKSK